MHEEIRIDDNPSICVNSEDMHKGNFVKEEKSVQEMGGESGNEFFYKPKIYNNTENAR